MRSILLALTLAASALLPAAAGAECLPSSAAVFAAHPDARHASYEGRSHPGRHCWFADQSRSSAGKSAGRQEVAGSNPAATATPLPRQRPASAPPAIQQAPVQVAVADPLREAMESYVVDKFWVLMWRARN